MIQQPAQSPGFLLWHVTLRWQRDVTAALKPLGLTHVQFVLLATAWWLNTRDEQPSQVSLATEAGTDVKMASQVVRTLERKGLITRETRAADTRGPARRHRRRRDASSPGDPGRRGRRPRAASSVVDQGQA